MFEPKKKPLATKIIFRRRLLRSIFTAFILILLSLLVGIMGYHFTEELSFIDAYLEAAMILSGMGPTATMHTTAGKIFSGTYALYSGLSLIFIIGVIIAPIAHRFFHKFHLEDDGEK